MSNEDITVIALGERVSILESNVTIGHVDKLILNARSIYDLGQVSDVLGSHLKHHLEDSILETIAERMSEQEKRIVREFNRKYERLGSQGSQTTVNIESQYKSLRQLEDKINEVHSNQASRERVAEFEHLSRDELEKRLAGMGQKLDGLTKKVKESEVTSLGPYPATSTLPPPSPIKRDYVTPSHGITESIYDLLIQQANANFRLAAFHSVRDHGIREGWYSRKAEKCLNRANKLMDKKIKKDAKRMQKILKRRGF